MATLPEQFSSRPEQQYATLLEVSQAIAAHQSLTELFQDLGRRLHTVLNFNYLSLILHDPVHEVMRLHTLHFDGVMTIQPGMEFGMEDSPSAEVWRTQAPLTIADAELETRFHRATKTLHDNGLRSFCSLPLTTARRKLGTMNLGSSTVNAYQDSALNVLQLVASQVAVAVENALNYEDAQAFQQQVIRERDRLKLLLDVNNAVVSNLALSELFRAIPGSVRNAMQCDAACLSLPDRDQAQLRVYGLDFPAGKGFMQDQMVLPMVGTSPGTAFRTRKPLRFGTAPKSLAPVALRVNAEEGFESGCFLPIMRGNRTLGVLHLLDRHKNAFSEEDVDFLRQVASQVAIALENALEFSELSESKDRLAEEGLYLRDEIRTEHHFEDILGNSSGLRQVLRQVETVAPNETTVLIQGETGTGKELVARAIHGLSTRRDNIFVKLNCAAIPLGLLESELFGHERGAFTSAVVQKKGMLEVADGGTVFLDEVGELPLSLQAKLLRVLQEREFVRVGGTRSIKVNVRFVAATNRDLQKAVKDDKFRLDLFYRLNVVSMTMPALREHSEDIPLLAEYFVGKFTERCCRRINGISAAARACLARYDWPGNVRELENAIERAVVVGSSDMISPEDLPEALAETAVADPCGSAKYHDAILNLKRQLILSAYEQAGGSFTEAAKLLGVHPNYLHRLVRNLDLRMSLKNAG